MIKRPTSGPSNISWSWRKGHEQREEEEEEEEGGGRRGAGLKREGYETLTWGNLLTTFVSNLSDPQGAPPQHNSPPRFTVHAP